MDIVLRENDVKRMIADALGVKIPPEDMAVQQDPLSVTISNAERYLNKPKPDLRGKPDEAPPQQQRDNGDSDVRDGDEEPLPSADDAPLMTMDDLKKESAGLAAAPPQVGSTSGQRSMGVNERNNPPPPTKGGKEQM